ncbi:MAG: asparagine synthase (glutamine-hydrolyzing) [Phycisphaerae bacterium]
MCGICGICLASPQARVSVELLDRMRDALRHRGPDGADTLIEGNVGLGHRRLSIIDVAGGAQPMYNEDRSVGIVFNGEIYNYKELKPGLERAGHRFENFSDTEVIVHLYEDLGPRCLDELNGMFVFAIWDRRTRRVFIARDRMGEKPLFYRFEQGNLAYASELKSLLADPAIPRQVDPHSLDDYLAYGYVPTDRCILQGVSKLAPASWMIWQDGRLQVERYWRPRFETGSPVDEDQCADEIERRLRDAVRIRLRSDVPLGLFLSGGVDSSATVAMASEASTTPVRTFSVGFREADYDELAFARRVAERFKTQHTELTVRDDDIGVLADLAYHLDEPFADPSALPTYYLCREARRHVTVCLSGDGGDEVFAGYRRYAQAARYAQMDRWTPRGVRQLAASATQLVPRHWTGRGVLEKAGADGAARYFAQCCKFPLAERLALLSPDVRRHVTREPRLFAPFFDDHAAPDLVSRMQSADYGTYLPDDILVKVDRMAMMSSLEVRVPFLDHTLIEFANRLPTRAKLHRGIGKRVLKRVLARHVPNEWVVRRKRGFGIPIKHWFRQNLVSFAENMLLGTDAVSGRWLDRSAVSGLIADHQRGGRDLSRRIWALLMLELWSRRYLTA